MNGTSDKFKIWLDPVEWFNEKITFECQKIRTQATFIELTAILDEIIRMDTSGMIFVYNL